MRLLRRDPASPNPQPDAQLDDDDFPTEIKTVSNLTGGEVSAGLLRRIREGARRTRRSRRARPRELRAAGGVPAERSPDRV